jgi:signal transduction histidine kinase
LLRWREWTVSTKAIIMLVIPLVLAIGGGVALIRHAHTAAAADSADVQLISTDQIIVTALTAVQRERAVAAGGATESSAALRAETSTAVTALEHAPYALEGDSVSDRVRATLAGLDRVRNVLAPARSITYFSGVTIALLNLRTARIARIHDVSLLTTLESANRLARARDYLDTARLLLAGGLSVKLLDIASVSAAQTATTMSVGWLEMFRAGASVAELQAYSVAVPSQVLDLWYSTTKKVLVYGAFHPVVSSTELNAAIEPVSKGLDAASAQLTAAATDQAARTSAGSASDLLSLIVILTICTALALALIVLLFREIRSSLAVLRQAAEHMAHEQIPEYLLKIRDGRTDTGPPPSFVTLPREFATVGAAFDVMGRQASETVTELTTMRSGYAEVFVNMFRRSQSLVQRQLRIVEQLEHDEQSPDRLARLFQLDHLVTRMRRNNENVLVLSGTEVLRKSAKPTSVEEIIQAAMSEVENYQRVEVIDPPRAKVVDVAANDLVRVLAELLDNATSFSPPETTVAVQAQVLRDGSLSLAVVDEGLGMSDEEVRAANERLTRLSSTELARSRRVGLLVVGRLAGRHGFGVELLGGDQSTGVSVLISVPADFVVDAERPGWADRRHALKAASQRSKSPAESDRRIAVPEIPDDVPADHLPSPEQRALVAVSPPDVSEITSLPESVAVGAHRSEDGEQRPALRDRPVPAPVGASRSENAEQRPALRDRPVPAPVGASRSENAERRPVLRDRPVPQRRAPSLQGSSPERPRRSHREELMEGAHANVPTDLPVRMPTRLIGKQPPNLAERVASSWFRARETAGQPRAVSAAPGVGEAGWGSAADASWRVLTAMNEPREYAYTEDGLPIREQGAHLVPGSTKPGGGTTPSRQPTERNPDRLRSRLSSFQRGVRKAKPDGIESESRPSRWRIMSKKSKNAPAMSSVPARGEASGKSE